jgi:Tfp pilus assembly protein FimT
MIELAMVVTITMVMAGFALPMVQQTVFRYRLNNAVSSVTGAIRSTRYQSLMMGYRYHMDISPTNLNYQLSSMVPPAVTYSNVGGAVPISGSSSPVTISAATTLEFRPNGQVSATTGAMNLNVTYQGVTKTITVTTYGNVTVTP